MMHFRVHCFFQSGHSKIKKGLPEFASFHTGASPEAAGVYQPMRQATHRSVDLRNVEHREHERGKSIALHGSGLRPSVLAEEAFIQQVCANSGSSQIGFVNTSANSGGPLELFISGDQIQSHQWPLFIYSLRKARWISRFSRRKS